MPLELNMPVVKLGTPALQAAQPVIWTAEMPHNLNIGKFLAQVSITKLATGAATKSIPLLTDAFQSFTWKINGTPNRVRLPYEIFGALGENAVDEKNNAGTVQYFQGGAPVAIVGSMTPAAYGNGVVTGKTIGLIPVLIGSFEDLMLQQQLANNTTTVAIFGLPFLYSQDFRKSYKAALAMALPTAFGDANGNVTGNLGGVILEMAMNPMPAGAGQFSAVGFAGNIEYDTTLAAQGSAVRLLKEKRLSKGYNAVGDIEVADQIKNIAGEALQFVLLSSNGDYIAKVVIKQGTGLKRTQTWEDNILSLRTSGVNVDGISRSQFPIIWDRTDDPTTGLAMDPNNELSIVATIGLAQGQGALVGTTLQINTGIYGAVE